MSASLPPAAEGLVRRGDVNLIAMVVDGPASAAGQLATEVGDAPLMAALRAGNERAFRDLVQRYHPALVRLARASVTSPAAAEEVVQDTWLAVIRGIAGFEVRSSLKTWIFRILVNEARNRAAGERRTIPMRSVRERDSEGPAVDPARFEPEGQRWPVTGAHHPPPGPICQPSD